MLNLKKVIVIVAILYLAQAKFEICFNLVADDTQNLHQAKCAEVVAAGGSSGSGSQNGGSSGSGGSGASNGGSSGSGAGGSNGSGANNGGASGNAGGSGSSGSGNNNAGGSGNSGTTNGGSGSSGSGSGAATTTQETCGGFAADDATKKVWWAGSTDKDGKPIAAGQPGAKGCFTLAECVAKPMPDGYYFVHKLGEYATKPWIECVRTCTEAKGLASTGAVATPGVKTTTWAVNGFKQCVPHTECISGAEAQNPSVKTDPTDSTNKWDLPMVCKGDGAKSVTTNTTPGGGSSSGDNGSSGANNGATNGANTNTNGASNGGAATGGANTTPATGDGKPATTTPATGDDNKTPATGGANTTPGTTPATGGTDAGKTDTSAADAAAAAAAAAAAGANGAAGASGAGNTATTQNCRCQQKSGVTFTNTADLAAVQAICMEVDPATKQPKNDTQAKCDTHAKDCEWKCT